MYFKLSLKGLNYIHGVPFVWNNDLNIIELSKSKIAWIWRQFLLIWALWEFIHQTYWFYIGLRDNDQDLLEVAIDLLYFTGGLICLFHVTFFLINSNDTVEFIKCISFSIIKQDPKTSKKFDFLKVLILFLIIFDQETGIITGLLYFRSPNHRRYTINIILSFFPNCMNIWVQCGIGFISQYVRMLHRGSGLLLYMFVQIYYCHYLNSEFGKLQRELIRSPKARLYITLRKLQLINHRYNNLFRHGNNFTIFTIWLNFLGYSVSSIILREKFVWPEYLLLPFGCFALEICGFLILYQMGTILTNYINLIRFIQVKENELDLNDYDFKFLKSLKPFQVEIGNIYSATRLSPLIFLVWSFDYFINGIILMR